MSLTEVASINRLLALATLNARRAQSPNAIRGRKKISKASILFRHRTIEAAIAKA